METSRPWLWDHTVTTSPKFSTNLRKLNLSRRHRKVGERQEPEKRKTHKLWVMFNNRTSWSRHKSFGETQIAKSRMLWFQIPREWDQRAWAELIVDFLGPTLSQDQQATLVTTQNSEMNDQSSTRQWNPPTPRVRPKIFTSWRSTMTFWELLIIITRASSSQFPTNTDQQWSAISLAKTGSQSVLKRPRARSKQTRRRVMSSSTLTRVRWRLLIKRTHKTCPFRMTRASFLLIPNAKWKNLFTKFSRKESQNGVRLRWKIWTWLTS